MLHESPKNLPTRIRPRNSFGIGIEQLQQEDHRHQAAQKQLRLSALLNPDRFFLSSEKHGKYLYLTLTPFRYEIDHETGISAYALRRFNFQCLQQQIHQS